VFTARYGQGLYKKVQFNPGFQRFNEAIYLAEDKRNLALSKDTRTDDFLNQLCSLNIDLFCISLLYSTRLALTGKTVELLNYSQ
jgi:hypothetical protein